MRLLEGFELAVNLQVVAGGLLLLPAQLEVTRIQRMTRAWVRGHSADWRRHLNDERLNSLFLHTF